MKLPAIALIFISLLTPTATSAQDSTQVDMSFSVGDTLVFGNTDSAWYTYIDYFVKTRIEPGDKTYNRQTGEGFYQYYFSTGDFDATKLSSAYKGKTCVIVAFQDVKGDDGIERTIVLARLESERHIAWIEMQPALEHGEIFRKVK